MFVESFMTFVFGGRGGGLKREGAYSKIVAFEGALNSAFTVFKKA